MRKQLKKDPSEWDYGFIEYFQKSIANGYPMRTWNSVLIEFYEAQRDYYTQPFRHINYLIQIDKKPNLNLKEPRWEIYKVSITFNPQRKIYFIE